MIKEQLPDSWTATPLSEVAAINPTIDKKNIDDDETLVSFVPMPAVEAESGRIDISICRRFKEVKKGYTGFLERDVIFAKITPCMENGKAAVIPKLKNDLGFGSTEFHVIRAAVGISPELLYYYVSSKWFRVEAEHNMTGAVGQRRVPTSFLKATPFPLPPTNEQKRIVAKIEELFSELDNGIAALKTARDQLKVYRQAVLKHAFEGKLTAKWREENKDKLESPEQLLARIQQERESLLNELIKKGNSEAKRFLAKVKKAKPIYPDGKLPITARWASLIDICTLIVDCHNKTAPYENAGIWLIRTPCIKSGKILLNEEARFISEETYDYWARRCPPMPGDIIFTREAPMGEVGIIPKNTKVCMGQRMMLLRRPSTISSKYVLYSMMEPGFLARMNQSAVGTGVKHLRVGDVEKLCIPLFSLEEQLEIVDRLDSQLSVIDEQEIEISKALTVRFRMIKSH